MQNIAALVRTINFISDKTSLCTHFILRHVNQKNIIFILDFIKMASLITKIDLFPIIFNYDFIYSTFFRSRQITFHFCKMNLCVSVDNKHSSIIFIIKKNGHVMVKACYFRFFPGPLYIC